MGEQYDAPNQQVVRPDGSGPADEGTGGQVPETPEPVADVGEDTVEIPADEVGVE
jgi:hypothetical protein